MRLCLITKNRFYKNDNLLISNGALSYRNQILGFEWEEFTKLIILGFKSNEKFSGYFYKIPNPEKIFIVGPSFQEEKRYFADRLKNIALFLKEIFSTRDLFKDIQIIFSPFFEYTPFIFLILKFIVPKAKFVTYIIGDYPEWNFYKNRSLFLKYLLIFLQKISILLSNEVWFISAYLFKKYFTKKGVLVRSSTVESVINYPKKIDLEIRILFVGRLAKEKNPEIPIIVAKKLKERGYNCNLKIVGDGVLRKELENRCRQLKLDNVYFTGWIKNRNKLNEIYKNSHILILSSSYGEGLGLVILEAMAQGCIVISTKSGGAVEIITEGINGFLVDIKDNEQIVNDMVEKIEALIKNPKIFWRISKNNIEKAKKWTLEKFSEIQKERILKLLEK